MGKSTAGDWCSVGSCGRGRKGRRGRGPAGGPPEGGGGGGSGGRRGGGGGGGRGGPPRLVEGLAAAGVGVEVVEDEDPRLRPGGDAQGAEDGGQVQGGLGDGIAPSGG